MKALTNADKRVIRSFLDRRADDSKKLRTDGKVLDGLWMGGQAIAEWKGKGKKKKLILNDLGSRAAQTVQRALKKIQASISVPKDPPPKKSVKTSRPRAGLVYVDGRWIKP